MNIVHWTYSRSVWHKSVICVSHRNLSLIEESRGNERNTQWSTSQFWCKPETRRVTSLSWVQPTSARMGGVRLQKSSWRASSKRWSPASTRRSTSRYPPAGSCLATTSRSVEQTNHPSMRKWSWTWLERSSRRWEADTSGQNRGHQLPAWSNPHDH